MNINDINDIQAESGVISTLLYHPDFILHSDFLKPSHFFDKKNGCIYWAIQELYKQGVDKIDSFNLSSMINTNSTVKKKMFEFDIGSLEELISLAKNVARETVEEYIIIAKQVTTLAFKRTLYQTLQHDSMYCFDESIDLGTLNIRVYDDINNLAEEFVVNEKLKLFGEKVDSIITDIKSRQTGKEYYGIPSKFPALNKYCTIENQEVVLIEGYRKQGKSILLLNELTHKLKNNVPCVYFDTELSDRNFMIRMLANISGVEVYKIKTGSYTESEETLVNCAIDFIKQAPLVHIYLPQPSKDKVYSVCKILKYKIGLQLVVYDYFKSSETESSKQYNDLGNQMNFFKNNICGELNLAGLAACQLNRSGEVADSIKLEQYASTVIKVSNKSADEISQDGEDCGQVKMFILANRNGEQMADGEYIDLVFNGNKCSFEQAKKQHEPHELPI